jgi:hypothetical protein
MPPTTTLYRPVGRQELDLIRASDMRAFPPRMPEQPIFYPVLTLEYARQIARDWNTRDERSGFVGYVLKFEVDSDYLACYEAKCVGDRDHLEYWIPAADLEVFNRHIAGDIQVLESYTASQERGDE